MSMLQEFLNIFDLEGVFPKVYDLKLHLHVDDRHRTSSVLEGKKTKLCAVEQDLC